MSFLATGHIPGKAFVSPIVRHEIVPIQKDPCWSSLLFLGSLHVNCRKGERCDVQRLEDCAAVLGLAVVAPKAGTQSCCFFLTLKPKFSFMDEHVGE